MSAVVSPVETDVLTALVSFITTVIGNSVQVIRGLGNRVPMPPAPFIALTPLFDTRLETSVDSYSATQQTTEESTRLDVQLDCYGPSAHSWAKIICALFRNQYGCAKLAPNCQPLYADEAHMMPLIDAEIQYEERWTATLSLQYNPVITVTAQTSNAAAVGLINVDERYPA